MATATTSQTTATLAQIHVREGFNARLHADDGLKESVLELGVVQPLTVEPFDGDVDDERPHYWLVAGHRRLAAAKAAAEELGAGEAYEVPIHHRESETREADAAVENLTQSELTVLEQARHIGALIDSGKTLGFCARILQTTEAVIANRLKVLDLPERAQAMFGPGSSERVMWTPRDADALAIVGDFSTELRDAVIDVYIEDNSNPSQNLGYALSRVKEPKVYQLSEKRGHGNGGLVVLPEKRQVPTQYGGRTEKPDLTGVGKKHLDLAEDLEKAVAKDKATYRDHYEVEFEPEVIDRGKALGSVLTVQRGHMDLYVVIDKEVLVDLVREQIERDHATMLAAKERAATERATPAAKSNDPARQKKAKLRESVKEQLEPAWAANLELGSKLVTEGAKVEVTMDVAKLFVYSVMGPGARFYGEGKRSSGSYDGGSIINILAEAGWRFVMRDLHTDVTKIRKDQTRGALKLEMCSDQEAEKAAFKFLDGAKTPEELFGRAICLMVAATYAVKHVAPHRDRTAAWTPSNKTASAALSRLSKDLVPTATKHVRKAIVEAYSTADQGIDQRRL